MTETAELAAFCSSLSFERLPSEVVRTIKSIVLDTLGVTLAGSTRGVGCAEVLAVARDCAGKPEATILGFGERLPVLSAAMANGGMSHALNFGAVGAGHLGMVLAAPMATAELLGGVSGRELIASLAAGMEFLARLAAALKASGRYIEENFLEGQLLGYFATAIASARVMQLDVAQMHSSIGLALMQASGTMQVVYDGDPPAKSVYAAFSNHGGLLSALLARKGLGARIAALEGRAGLFQLHFKDQWEPAPLTRGLGEEYQLLNVRFKPWPCSAVTHPFIDAAIQFRKSVLPEDIGEIRLRGGAQARAWFEPEEMRRRPPTAAAAANSVFYTVGRALSKGDVDLQDFTAEAIQEPSPLVDRMTYSIDESLGSSGVVELVTRDGRVHSMRIDHPAGSAAKPMTEEQLRKKFSACARLAAVVPDIERVIEAVDKLESLGSMESLMASFRHPEFKGGVKAAS